MKESQHYRYDMYMYMLYRHMHMYTRLNLRTEGTTASRAHITCLVHGHLAFSKNWLVGRRETAW